MNSHNVRQYSRRGVLAAAGATGVSLLVGGVAASSDSDGDWEDGGDEITRTFEEDEVRQYLPRLDISRGARDRLIGVYAWIARSPDHDLDAITYWMRYTHQDPGAAEMGRLDRVVGVFASDAHLWDHEPATIYVDPDSGDVERVIVTGYHHYPLEASAENAPFSADHSAAATHAELEVVDPWSHYRFNGDRDGADVTNAVDLNSFLDVRDSWNTRGVFDSSSRLAVDNPWAIKDGRVDSWWAENSRDARAARIWHLLGLRGADETDPEFDQLR